jgi:hypothetical protein
MATMTKKRSVLIVLVAAEIVGSASRAMAHIDFSDFANLRRMQLVGTAQITGTRLRLTPAIGWSVGAAWFTSKQHVRDGFETTFQFQLVPDGFGADGFAFVVQNGTTGTTAVGVQPNPGYDTIDNSLAVEFDTFHNTNMTDPDGNHISVHTRGRLPNDLDESYSIGATSNIPNLKDGATHTARIVYTPGTLQVFIDDLGSPALAVSLNLAQTLGLDRGRAWVGFTAGTGASFETHDILSWSLYSYADPRLAVSRWPLYR